MTWSVPGPHRRVFFRPFGKMHKTCGYSTIHRAIRMLDSRHARLRSWDADVLVLAEIEAKRAALAALLTVP